MPLGAVLGATAVSGVVSAVGANKAAKAQEKAANRAQDTQMRMFETSREDQKPYTTVGSAAIDSLAGLYGLKGDGEPAFNDASIAAFRNSPDYEFARQEGIRSLDASAASKGLLDSGGYGEDLMKFGQGLATQNFGNYVQRLYNLAGLGAGAAARTGAAAIETGRGVANSQMDAGEAQASGIAGVSNALSGTIADMAGSYATNRLVGGSRSAYGNNIGAIDWSRAGY